MAAEVDVEVTITQVQPIEVTIQGSGPAGADGVVQSIVAGSNVTVDDTDPANPIVSATGGGGGGGSVDSVNGQTGVVVLDQDDIGDGTTYKRYSQTEKTKLAGIETAADVTDATNVAAAGAFMKSVDDTDDITTGATNKFATAAEKTKVGFISVTQSVDLDTVESNSNDVPAIKTKTDFITVTQAVNLDTMESDIAALANGMVYKGDWDASAGTFPGAGAAKIGWFYYVSVAGTVGGVAFAVGDNVIAIVNNASTTVYAANWSKHDQTDAVQSVAGKVGAVTLVTADITDITATATELNYVDGVTSSVQTQLDAKQASDTDLTVIAGLIPANDDLLQRKSGAWTNRTPAQVKTDLALTSTDVGLGNLTNFAQLKVNSNLTDVNNAVSAFNNIKQDASTVATGVVELANVAEVNTGTDAGRVVSPDTLAGSYAGTKPVSVYAVEALTALTTGDGKAYFRIPSTLNGMDLVSCAAAVVAKSTSGLPTIQIARGRQSSATSAHTFVDMLTTRITIDANEFDSKDATTPAVIDTSNDDVLTGDLIRIDVDVAGTAATGLIVTMSFRLP